MTPIMTVSVTDVNGTTITSIPIRRNGLIMQISIGTISLVAITVEGRIRPPMKMQTITAFVTAVDGTTITPILMLRNGATTVKSTGKKLHAAIA